MVSPSRLCDLHTPALKACWQSIILTAPKAGSKWPGPITSLNLRCTEPCTVSRDYHYSCTSGSWKSFSMPKVHTEDFYSNFEEVFMNVCVIPKMHYLIHYPRHFLLHGPFAKLSCMQFDLKHRFSKLQKKPQVAKKTRNFKNISATLSCRHQVSLMHALAQSVQTMPTKGGTKTDSLPQINAEWYQELCTAGIHVQCFSWATLSARPIWTSGVQPLIV